MQVSTGHPTEVSQIHVAKQRVKLHPVQLVSIFKVVEMTLCLREHACPVPTCQVTETTTTVRTVVSRTLVRITPVRRTVLPDSIVRDVVVRVRVHVYPVQMHFKVSTTQVMVILRMLVPQARVKPTVQMDSTEIPVKVRAAELVWHVRHVDRTSLIRDVAD